MKARVGVIGGSGLAQSGLLQDVKPLEADTPFGKASAPLEVGRVGELTVAFLLRHGAGHAKPPHQVPYKANLWALKQLGVEGVLATSSVGSLKTNIQPRSFLIPSDFISFWDIPTYYDDKVVHVTPAFSEDLRKKLFYRSRELELRVRGSGIYFQTRGPRLETRAEIAMIKDFADVVGMTVASEATLASELQLPYAAVCSVDNYCHGIVEEPLTYEQILKVQGQNSADLRRIIQHTLEVWR
jgi:5'-methylthioadenosine phosphorylase